MIEAAVGRLLVFRVGNLACAAEVDQVREILPRLPTTRIPGAPPVVAGLVNVRGTLVTVVEGWRALGQSPPTPTPTPTPAAATASSDNGGAEREQRQGSTLVLELAGGGKLIGFTVDEVMDMVAAGDTTLEHRQGLAGIDPTLVRAVGRRGGDEGEVFVVLDIAALLGPILTT